jgi:hypothetical protein
MSLGHPNATKLECGHQQSTRFRTARDFLARQRSGFRGGGKTLLEACQTTSPGSLLVTRSLAVAAWPPLPRRAMKLLPDRMRVGAVWCTALAGRSATRRRCAEGSSSTGRMFARLRVLSSRRCRPSYRDDPPRARRPDGMHGTHLLYIVGQCTRDAAYRVCMLARAPHRSAQEVARKSKS